MNTYESLLTRRSIRKYTDQKISNDTIKNLLNAGLYAPTAFSLEPWHLLVINKVENVKDLFNPLPHAEMLNEAQAAILICGDKKIQEIEGLIVQDCSAVTQNILLEAHELGLGACWIGIYPFDEFVDNIKSYFKLPPNILPVSMVSLGYPAEKVEQPERYKPGKIHFNKW